MYIYIYMSIYTWNTHTYIHELIEAKQQQYVSTSTTMCRTAGAVGAVGQQQQYVSRGGGVGLGHAQTSSIYNIYMCRGKAAAVCAPHRSYTYMCVRVGVCMGVFVYYIVYDIVDICYIIY